MALVGMVACVSVVFQLCWGEAKPQWGLGVARFSWVLSEVVRGFVVC